MSTEISFQGFPSQMKFIPVPLLLITEILPRVDSLLELRVILNIFRLLYQQRRYPRFITESELLSEKTFLTSKAEELDNNSLAQIINELTVKNIIISLKIEAGGAIEKAIMINTPPNRILMEKISKGEIRLPLLKLADVGTTIPQGERPGIYALYEQNIGLLTPIIAEQLREAESRYPISWIEEAFKEAVSLNKRSWRYIERILERWATEGKSDGKTGRYPGKKITPEEYFKGKFGHIVKH